METAIAIAIGIVILALLPIAPRLFWRGVCPPDCRHAWRAVRRTIGSPPRGSSSFGTPIRVDAPAASRTALNISGV